VPASSPGTLPASAAAESELQGPFPIGYWHGEIICNNRTSEVFLSLSPGEAGRFYGRINLFPPGFLMHGTSHSHILAELDGGERQARAAILSKDHRGINAGLGTSFSLKSVSADILEARFQTASCPALQLRRDVLRSVRRTPLVQAAVQGGTFGAAGSGRDRCRALTDWVARYRQEAPNQGRQVGNTPHLEALLFGDENFVPVFGFPADQLTGAFLNPFRRAWQECLRDPLISQDLYGLQVDRAFIVGGLTSFGHDAIVYIVQKQREVKHHVRMALAAAAQETEGAEARVREVRSLLETSQLNFWRSDFTALMASLNRASGQIAARSGERQMAAIRALSDPAAFLTAAREVIGGQAPWLASVPADQRTSWMTEIQRRREQVVGEIRAPISAALNALPETLESLRSTDQLLAGHDRALAMLDPEGQNQVRAERRAWQERVLQRLVSEQAEALDSTAGGMAGLEASAAWNRAFDQKFASFGNYGSVQNARRNFRQVRLAQLTDAIADFERELGMAAPQGQSSAEFAQSVLSRYLSINTDVRLPISFEYRLLAAQRAAR
jgi:hypothetical protein